MKSLVYSIIFITFVYFNSINSIRIGHISNSVYQSPFFHQILSNLSCDKCLCHALNISAIGWNCFIFNQSCQLFTNYSSYQSALHFLPNTTFFFTDFPLESTTLSPFTSSTNAPQNSSCETFGWNETFTVVAGVDGRSDIANDRLNRPNGLFFHCPTSSLFIADTNANRIQKWLLGHNDGTTVAGDSFGSTGSSNDRLDYPTNIFWIHQTNSLFIADTNNHRIMRFILSNTTTTFGTRVAGTGSTGQAFNQLNSPTGLVIDRNQMYLYVADTNNHRVIRWNLNQNSTIGQIIVGITGLGSSSNNTLKKPSHLLFNQNNSALYILDTDNSRVQKYFFDLNITRTIAGNTDGTDGSTSTELKKPLSMTIDSMDNLYVADTQNNRIQLFCRNSINGRTILNGVNWDQPKGIFIDSSNNLYVSNSDKHTVLKFHFIL